MMDAIKALCEDGFSVATHGKAVRRLVAQSADLVAPTVEYLLDRHHIEMRKPFSMSHDILALALDLAHRKALPASVERRLVVTAAHAGFIGRFPDITMERFGRQPNVEEVTLLLRSEIRKTGSQSLDSQRKIVAMAADCMSPEGVANVEKAFSDFNDKFRSLD